jgi:hypothetical protein
MRFQLRYSITVSFEIPDLFFSFTLTAQNMRPVKAGCEPKAYLESSVKREISVFLSFVDRTAS